MVFISWPNPLRWLLFLEQPRLKWAIFLEQALNMDVIAWTYLEE